MLHIELESERDERLRRISRNLVTIFMLLLAVLLAIR